MSKVIKCANPDCKNEVDQSSFEWTMKWTMVWVEKAKKSFDSCSVDCSKAIRKHYDEDPRQIPLFREGWRNNV